MYELLKPYLKENRVEHSGMSVLTGYLKGVPESDREDVVDGFVKILLSKEILRDQ
jgi:hypothetical protein